MTRARRRWLAVRLLGIGCVLFAASDTLAAEGSAGGNGPGRYPVAVSVALPAGAPPFRFEYEPLVSLPNPRCTVEVGGQAVDAVRGAVGQVFDTVSNSPAVLELEVAVARAEVEPAGRGGRAVVTHRVALRVAGGPQLDVWTLDGESPVVGLDAEGIQRALARAAREAASRLERSLAESAAVRAWLLEHGISPRPPPPLPAAARAVERVGTVVFLEAGAGVVFGEGGEYLPAATVRGGVSSSRLIVQATMDRFGTDLAAGPAGGFPLRKTRMDVTALGLDAGAVLRLDRSEIRGGFGLHHLRGRGGVPYYLSSIAQPWRTSIERVRWGGISLFASSHTTWGPWGGWDARIRLSAEIRKYLDASLPGDAFGPGREVANLQVGIGVGVELPAWRAPARAE